jgi:hypothetical protein
MGSLMRRLRALLRRDRLDDELAEEIATHLERRQQHLIAEGVDPADATTEAPRAALAGRKPRR